MQPSYCLPTLAPWLRGSHLETLYPALLARCRINPSLRFRRQRIQTPDQDFLDLDWVDATAPNAPTLVMFHGLEGSSRSGYAQALASVCDLRGWRCVVVHFRGCSGEMNLAPRAYFAGDIQDIEFALTSIGQDLRRIDGGRGPLTAIGVSLGGNALARWAGERGPDAGAWLDSLIAVSAPFDLSASGQAIDHGVNRLIYGQLFLSTMKQKALLKAGQYPGLFDLDRVLRARTLREFDDAFTAPLHGYRGVDDYWCRASAKAWLGQLAVPSLLINAHNDPLVPATSLPRADQVSQAVELCQPWHGGHVGFTASTRLGLPGEIISFAQSLCRWAAGTWLRS